MIVPREDLCGESSGCQSVSLPGRELSQIQEVGDPSNRFGLSQALFTPSYPTAGPYTMDSESGSDPVSLVCRPPLVPQGFVALSSTEALLCLGFVGG